jgi:manganese efflux pump family protein
MDIATLIFIAVGLSMDTFAISITNGFTIRDLRISKVLTISLYLTVFQATMPVIGWMTGIWMKKYIMTTDHWIAFSLLTIIGLKMIYEGTKEKKEKQKSELRILILVGQSIATSIDAMVVGISFAFVKISIFTPILIIGLTTFILSLAGLYLGKLYSSKVDKKLGLIGGLILIGIGTKILIEHLYN